MPGYELLNPKKSRECLQRGEAFSEVITPCFFFAPHGNAADAQWVVSQIGKYLQVNCQGKGTPVSAWLEHCDPHDLPVSILHASDIEGMMLPRDAVAYLMNVSWMDELTSSRMSPRLYDLLAEIHAYYHFQEIKLQPWHQPCEQGFREALASAVQELETGVGLWDENEYTVPDFQMTLMSGMVKLFEDGWNISFVFEQPPFESYIWSLRRAAYQHKSALLLLEGMTRDAIGTLAFSRVCFEHGQRLRDSTLAAMFVDALSKQPRVLNLMIRGCDHEEEICNTMERCAVPFVSLTNTRDITDYKGGVGGVSREGPSRYEDISPEDVAVLQRELAGNLLLSRLKDRPDGVPLVSALLKNVDDYGVSGWYRAIDGRKYESFDSLVNESLLPWLEKFTPLAGYSPFRKR